MREQKNLKNTCKDKRQVFGRNMLVLAAMIFMIPAAGCRVIDSTKSRACAGKMTGVYNVLEYGAKGDGVTNDAKAIQKAIDACFEAGGGRVLLPGGRVYFSHSIVLKSNIDFHLGKGAILQGGGKLEDYTIISPAKYGTVAVFISAEDAENLTISGGGIIDGAGHSFMHDKTEYIYRPKGRRPMMLYLVDCEHVSIKDVTFRNAPALTIYPLRCSDLLIEGIRILNDLKIPNCDGIHPDSCQDVRIANCHIEAGDDGIVLKNNLDGFKDRPCENITVTGCTVVSRSSAFKIGTSSWGDFRNIVVDSCVFYNSHRGISIQTRDYGTVENLIFSNIIIESRRFNELWWGSGEPIYVTNMPRNEETKLGRARNIRFSNILCKGENGIFIHGWEDSPIENLVFDNVRVEIGKESEWQGGWYDTRPSVISRVSPGSNAGIYCKWAKDVTFRNTSVVWAENPAEYFGSALEVHNVDGLILENFKGIAAHPERYPDRLID